MAIIPLIYIWIYSYIYFYIITLRIIFTITYIAAFTENLPCLIILFANDRILHLIYHLDYSHYWINYYKYNQYEWNELLLEWI